jgi:spore maturation protein CgeB
MSHLESRSVAILQPPARTSLLVSHYCAETLRSMGHQVSSLLYFEDRLASRLPFGAAGAVERAWRRRKLLSWLERVGPELILVIKGARIAPSTIEWVRRRLAVPWACWFYGDPVSLYISTTISPYYDYFFTTDPASAEAHRKAGAARVSVLPYAIHPPLLRPLALAPEERTALRSEVVFSGTINSENRRAVLEALVDFDLKVWGGVGDEYVDDSRRLVKGELQLSEALQRRLVGKWAWGEEVPRIYAAASVVLNVQHPDLLNMRLFEAPACGAFLLTDGRDYLGEYFEPELEVALYDGPHDVADRVAYWISRPEERAAIAEAGYRRAHREHTYAHRMKVLLDTCFGPSAAVEAVS